MLRTTLTLNWPSGMATWGLQRACCEVADQCGGLLPELCCFLRLGIGFKRENLCVYFPVRHHGRCEELYLWTVSVVFPGNVDIEFTSEKFQCSQHGIVGPQ